MLVLSRKPGEVLKIGDDITITVLESNGKTLRLGIEAPREVRVLRGELQAWGDTKPKTSRGHHPRLSMAS